MNTNTKFKGYIGTYTKGDSKGIYAFELDTKNATITNVRAVGHIENPTYVTISQDNQTLYAVAKEGDQGGVASFSIDNQTGDLTFLNSIVTPGSSPCHVSMDSQNRFVFSANYHKGTVESYLVNQENGSLKSHVSVIQHEGSGPDPRQEKPHTHFSGVTPDEKYLAVIELGSDQLITYQIGTSGELMEVSRLGFKPGSGPRHLDFHPNKRFAYVMTEFSSEVVTLQYNEENGSFNQIQAISTIPEDFKENNQGSAIHLSADGRFVYAGNRGHNSIAVFKVDAETGELLIVERVSSEGDWPRDFMIDPTGTFVVSSNQESHNLVLYSRDTETGRLTLLQSDFTVPYPVCVKFLHV
ncbi:MAG: lactonase family protein [Bacillota bacterium]|nr:lactonase family protein [Bacillota bacterium]